MLGNQLLSIFYNAYFKTILNMKSPYSTEPVKIEIGDYKVEIRLPIESEDWETEKKRLQVNITSKHGKEYYVDFVTLDYIQEVMDEKFPELGNGNYFPGRGRIILKDLNVTTVMETLENLLLDYEYRLEDFSEPVNIYPDL